MLIDNMDQVHKLSFQNKQTVQDSQAAGCFHCCLIFAAKKVVDFVEERKYPGTYTALCPYCGIDAVIGASNFPELSIYVMMDMNEVYFSSPEIKI